ncbi:hypothetical protein ABPG74_014026 [Tetrahymena malaccensis]
MNKKTIETLFQIFRLFFYCLAFVVCYLSIKYLLIKQQINTDITFNNSIGLAIYQLSFWVLTTIAEQITGQIFYSVIGVKNFHSFKQKIKIFTIIYILVPIALAFYLVILFFGDQLNIDDAFQVDENSAKIQKILTIIEFVISACLQINLIYIYRYLSYLSNQQNNQPLIYQPHN